MKTATLATPQEKQQTPSARLRAIDSELSAIQEQQQAAHSRIVNNEQELAGCNAMHRSLQFHHDTLLEAVRAAAAALKECQIDATRQFGKATEHASIQRLMASEKEHDAAKLALDEFLAPAPIQSVQDRIEKLRAAIAEDKAFIATAGQRVPELYAERVQVLSALTTEGQISLLRSFNDVLSVIEEFGLSLVTIRNADPAQYNKLLANISLTQEEIGQLFCEDTSDGIHFYRHALTERQGNIKAHLQQLTA